MIEIYGKPACPYCEKAKSDFTREELFEQFPTARTFPQIKINEKVVGGYEQLVTYIEETGYNGTGYIL
jgi:glutaredoxin